MGPYNDHGWSEAHYSAGKYVEAHLPNTQMIYVDNLNSAAKPGVTVPQVVAVAERHRCGSLRAHQQGVAPGRCFAVLMVGRLDDYLRANGVTHLADYLSFAMVERGLPDEVTFPGRCWGELWADLEATGDRLAPMRLWPDPERPAERGFAVLALPRHWRPAPAGL